MATMKKKTARNNTAETPSMRKKKFERRFGNFLFHLAWLIPVLGSGYGTCKIIEKCNEDKRKTVLVDKKQHNKNKPAVNAGQRKE